MPGCYCAESCRVEELDISLPNTPPYIDRWEAANLAEKLSLKEAAERLGISKEAVRKRIKAGKLRATLVSGKWQIFADELPPISDQRPRSTELTDELTKVRQESAVARAELARLESHNEDLRRQLEERTEELKRRDTLLLDLQKRIPELPSPNRKDPGRDQAVTDQARQRMEARRQEASTQEKPRSWWRRFWNGD